MIRGFNTASFAVAGHAVWRAGGAVGTMSPPFTVREMPRELADVRVRYLFAAPAVLERATEAARLAGRPAVLSLGEPNRLTALDALGPAAGSAPLSRGRERGLG